MCGVVTISLSDNVLRTSTYDKTIYTARISLPFVNGCLFYCFSLPGRRGHKLGCKIDYLLLSGLW